MAPPNTGSGNTYRPPAPPPSSSFNTGGSTYTRTPPSTYAPPPSNSGSSISNYNPNSQPANFQRAPKPLPYTVNPQVPANRPPAPPPALAAGSLRFPVGARG